MCSWLLDRSCRGVSSVSGILRYVFESGKFFEEEDSAEQLGVYLIVDSAAKQQYLVNNNIACINIQAAVFNSFSTPLPYNYMYVCVCGGGGGGGGGRGGSLVV